MTRKNGLPRRTYAKHGAYFFVTLDRRWIRLSSIADGLPRMYLALSRLEAEHSTLERMPAVVLKWLAASRGAWGANRSRPIPRSRMTSRGDGGVWAA